MTDRHQFDQKMYRVATDSNDSYFVIAYSEVHAVVEVVNNNINNGVEDYAGEYNIENVSEVSEEDMEDIIIDYNYAKGTINQESLLDAFQELTKYVQGQPDFYGVVSDDFTDYN